MILIIHTHISIQKMANIGEGSLQQSRYNKSAALAKLEKEIKVHPCVGLNRVYMQ